MPSPERTALIVRGGWAGHQPIETTELFVPFLEQHGFTVRIEESTAAYADAEALAAVDLIVQNLSIAPIEPAEVVGVRAAVEAGTGLAGWHGGLLTASNSPSPFLQLIGAQFAEHPGKAPDERTGEPSDVFVPHTIEMTELGRRHEITAGIDDFALTTEQYWVLHDDYLDVLATTTQAVRAWEPWTRPVTSPAVWTRQWGRGRIFVATPGHSVEVLQDPNVRTIVERGLLWAAR